MYQGDDDGGRPGDFTTELARIVNDRTLPVHILLSIGEHALTKLDIFEREIRSPSPTPIRLEHLDRWAAHEAIVGPIDQWDRLVPDGGLEIEPALVEQLIEGMAAGRTTIRVNGESPETQATDDRIEASYLQLVLERLWRETAAGAHTLELQHLTELGGVGRSSAST